MVDRMPDVPSYFAKDGEDSPELDEWKRDHPDWFVAGHWTSGRDSSGTGGPTQPGLAGAYGRADDRSGGASPTGVDMRRQPLPGTAPDWGRPMPPDQLEMFAIGSPQEDRASGKDIDKKESA